ncbi:MAG: hypothetical protein ABH883_05055 [Candidatus Omnitrophota bacterium]
MVYFVENDKITIAPAREPEILRAASPMRNELDHEGSRSGKKKKSKMDGV